MQIQKKHIKKKGAEHLLALGAIFILMIALLFWGLWDTVSGAATFTFIAIVMLMIAFVIWRDRRSQEKRRQSEL